MHFRLSKLETMGSEYSDPMKSSCLAAPLVVCIVPCLAADGEAVLAGQHDVQQDQIEAAFTDAAQSVSPSRATSTS